MGSGASKKANNNAAELDEDDEEDYDTFSKKRLGGGKNSNYPKLEQAGLLPKLQSGSDSSPKPNKSKGKL